MFPVFLHPEVRDDARCGGLSRSIRQAVPIHTIPTAGYVRRSGWSDPESMGEKRIQLSGNHSLRRVSEQVGSRDDDHTVIIVVRWRGTERSLDVGRGDLGTQGQARAGADHGGDLATVCPPVGCEPAVRAGHQDHVAGTGMVQPQPRPSPAGGNGGDPVVVGAPRRRRPPRPPPRGCSGRHGRSGDRPVRTPRWR